MATPPSRAADLLAVLAAEWKHPVTPAQVVALCAFMNRLLEWNQRINLTGARSIEELVQEHLPDSFAMAQMVAPGARIVDVGSGGGLPALPFTVLRPDCLLTLVEPRGKRAAFLRTIVRELGVPATVEESRVEDLEDLKVGSWDCASSRATFAPEDWVRIAGSVLSPQGLALVFTTPAGASPLLGRASSVREYGGRRVLLAVPVGAV